MGADWYSMTCIGLKVPREKIIVEEIEYRNLCGCNPKTDPDDCPNAKYCPICGRLVRRQVKIDRPLFDLPKDYYNEEAGIKGWPVMYDTDARNFYICIFTSGRVEYEKMSPIPRVSEDTLIKFRRDMELIGLWDGEQFGLWTITYCSY